MASRREAHRRSDGTGLCQGVVFVVGCRGLRCCRFERLWLGDQRRATVTLAPRDTQRHRASRQPVPVCWISGHLRRRGDGRQLSHQWSHNGAVIPGDLVHADAGIHHGCRPRFLRGPGLQPAGSATSGATLTVTAPSTQYESAIAASRPILYLRMNETAPVSQNTATNLGSTGTAGNGFYLGSLTRGTPGALAGNVGTAVTLSGGRVSVGYNAAWNPPGSFSVECWAKPSNTGTGNRVLIQSDDQRGVSGQMRTTARDGRSAERNEPAVRDRRIRWRAVLHHHCHRHGRRRGRVWSHFAATYDTATLAVTLYVNGVAVTNVIADAAVLLNTAAPLLLGDRGFGGWNFAGSLDEVAVYPVLLSAGQLRAHYEAALQAATAPGYCGLVVADGAADYLTLDGVGWASAGTPAHSTRALWAADRTLYGGAGTTVEIP